MAYNFWSCFQKAAIMSKDSIQSASLAIQPLCRHKDIRDGPRKNDNGFQVDERGHLQKNALSNM